MIEREADFRAGYWFGLFLARTMGFNPDIDAIYEQLRSVARGDLSLMASPAEVMRELQSQMGRPLTEQELQLASLAIPTNRAEQDGRNRELARLILRLMGQPA